MKKTIFLLSLVFSACQAIAQSEETVNETLKITTGGTFSKPKIFKGLEKIAVTQATVYFKTATTREVLENERGAFGGRKSGGGSVAGTITAYLDFTDKEMNDSDYQTLADDFYDYLNKKLEDNKIKTIGWSEITAPEFYQEDGDDVKDVTKDYEAMKRKGQLYHQINAKKGKTLLKHSITGGMNIGFAFGKLKRASKYTKELDAPMAILHLTVDFADIFLDGEVSTGTATEYQAGGITKITKRKDWKMNANVAANIKIAANGGNSTLFNEKMISESLSVTKDISSNLVFASSVKEDATLEKLKKKDNIFAKDFNMNPVLISTTKEKYKAAAQKALHLYADMLVAKIKYS